MARPAPLTTAAVVALIGVAVGGAGFLNGDAAAYVAQALSGQLNERWVHYGYLWLAYGLSWWGDGLPRALDTATALAAGVAVWASARGAAQPSLAALVAAGCVLPWAAFAEVDVLWMAGVTSAAVLPAEWAAGLAMGAAVSVSPTALLALPWVVWTRGRWHGVALGATSVVVGLTALSHGDWWVGDRGVLQAPRLFGRTVEAWGLSGTWVLALLARDRRLLGLAPLLLAPPDTPAWVMLGVAASRSLSPPNGARGLVLLVLLSGLWGLGERRARVAREHRVLTALAQTVPAEAVLEAPWSWGARWSVLAGGTVYGRHWVAVPRPVRDQQRCPAAQVVRLPPGEPPSTGTIRVDAWGVHWGPGC